MKCEEKMGARNSRICYSDKSCGVLEDMAVNWKPTIAVLDSNMSVGLARFPVNRSVRKSGLMNCRNRQRGVAHLNGKW